MAASLVSFSQHEEGTWTAGERVHCWQCGAEHSPDYFCPACGAIQPLPEQVDYFRIMGVPRRLALDLAALQERYYALHRLLHPDRFQTGAQSARVASLRNTAAVNRAFATLRDPIDRGLYWLALHGESVGAGNNRVPPALAALVFETQEQLEELRAARETPAAEGLAAAVRTTRAELVAQRDTLLELLQANFVAWDAGGDAATLHRELKSLLSDLAYLGTLLRDIDRELER
ncbi:hypothetical protein L6Q96_05745 [Candidatus Binatia bacterium]|nr:hypothetical protein [Candidatus Binatia bacterium]